MEQRLESFVKIDVQEFHLRSRHILTVYYFIYIYIFRILLFYSVPVSFKYNNALVTGPRLNNVQFNLLSDVPGTHNKKTVSEYKFLKEIALCHHKQTSSATVNLLVYALFLLIKLLLFPYVKGFPLQKTFFYVRYSTLLHLLPLRFRFVGGCWDRTQELG
jgi:hypothetical protein